VGLMTEGGRNLPGPGWLKGGGGERKKKIDKIKGGRLELTVRNGLRRKKKREEDILLWEKGPGKEKKTLY